MTQPHDPGDPHDAADEELRTEAEAVSTAAERLRTTIVSSLARTVSAVGATDAPATVAAISGAWREAGRHLAACAEALEIASKRLDGTSVRSER